MDGLFAYRESWLMERSSISPSESGGELVEVVEDGVVGGGRHAINIAYGIGLPWGKDEERARGTGSKA